jgi:CheY-like chemotaxis protein
LTKPVKQSALYNTLVGLFLGHRIEQRSQASAPLFDATLGQRNPLRILLAEDMPVNQKLMLTMLERMGYKASVAGNGLEVLAALRRQVYDVILMDVQMPEMDGLEASRQIRSMPLGSKRPRVVALTANAMMEDREACREAGMDDYLSKPVQVKELHAVLERCGDWVRARAGISDQGQTVPRSPAIDPAAMEMFRQMGGAQVISDLLGLFRSETPAILTAMRDALASSDGAQLRDCAHSLKGTASNLGAQTLALLCAELEKRGKQQVFDGADELVTRAEREYEAVCSALEAGGE